MVEVQAVLPISDRRKPARATTPPQGEDKPSPLLWTSLASRFVGIVGASFEIHHCNAAGGLDIHSVNAASAASYAQTECKEASTAAQSGEMQGKASPPCSTPLPPVHGEVHHIPVFCGTAVARNTCNHLSLMLDLSKNKYSCLR